MAKEAQICASKTEPTLNQQNRIRCLNAHNIQGRIKNRTVSITIRVESPSKFTRCNITLEVEDLLCSKRHFSHQTSHDFPLTSSKHLLSYNFRPSLVLHSQQHPQPSIILLAHKHIISTFASEKCLLFFFPHDIGIFILFFFCTLLTTLHIAAPTAAALGLSKAAFCADWKLRYLDITSGSERTKRRQN